MSQATESFDDLISDVQACRDCPSMTGCTRVLSWANGSPGAEVMFVGEAPGRLGADRTAVPFHGDVAGDNFERLLNLSGLPRSEVFITNAVLCNPRDRKGNNAPPTRKVLKECSQKLKRQIEIVRPLAVVTLGAAALESTRLIEPHDLSLKSDVRTVSKWNGLNLIPLYHPGARAMIHRNFAKQSSDYYFIGEWVRRQSRRKKNTLRSSKKLEESWEIVQYLLSRLGTASLFRIHKLLYLADYHSLEKFSRRITNFVYIRQKDGPYCVELGSRWFKDHQTELSVKKSNGVVQITWKNSDLFQESPKVEAETRVMIDWIIDETSSLNDSQLKTRAYLTKPMKAALKAERFGSTQLNKPLF